jgi:branched-subunit amino acid aminotransferase/4-amino-4-deoxychorismate lyase
VTREAVIELAREIGLEVWEELIPPSVLAGAEEAFLTNSLLGVAPLVRVDGRSVGRGQPGSLTRTLAERYRSLVASEAG